MDQEAINCLQKRQWKKGSVLFTKLLSQATDTNKKISYFLNRSECYLHIGMLAAVVDDSEQVIQLLKERQDSRDISDNTARTNLIQALFLLKRFGEAEAALREWLALLDKSAEAPKLLERLHLAMHEVQKSTLLRNELSTLIAHSNNNSLLNNANYSQMCRYCNLSFRDKSEFQAHCRTEEHQLIIMSDDGRDWSWRLPPRDLDLEKYILCKHWAEKQFCRYGNTCLEAHGLDELNEWTERHKYRQMKLAQACAEQLLGKSYTQKFLEKLKCSSNPSNIMQDKVSNVHERCNNILTTCVTSKSATKEWTFILKSKDTLQAVSLVYDAHRAYFEIDEILCTKLGVKQAFELSNKQEWLCDKCNGSIKSDNRYTVTVKFCTNVYGIFRQTVIFDFGTEPVLCKKLCVDVVPAEQALQIEKIKQEIAVISKEFWSNSNSTIIPFETSNVYYNELFTNENKWNNLYPCPKDDNFVITSDAYSGKLSRYNYCERMHTLLYMEEFARNEEINKFNVKAVLHVVRDYMLATPTPNALAKYSSDGELFAFMNLNQDLSEDTSCGRLLLNNCSKVLISVQKPKVYEAVVEDKGKNIMYLRLSATIVNDLKLKHDATFTARLQFQLNRLLYCEWHQAIDNLPDLQVIFPDIYIEPLVPWSPEKQWNTDTDLPLNIKQKEALIAITAPTEVQLPPILLIGPFGSGKTFTFAQTVKLLLQQENAKILICTHSNSAADIYIKDYFHKYYSEGHPEARPLRIYYKKRWVYSVNPVVQQYCLITELNRSREFLPPTREDIDNHRIIVVTLSTSLYLCDLELPLGYFTHILIDEAAQTLECETVMPLFLATKSTRIVLAGDHMQLSPEIYSKFAKELNLHVSLLERLYDCYPATFPCKILLSENYRSHEAIVDFTSEMFYEQKLVVSGQQLRHPELYPLTFFTARGEDLQDVNSTAFYNVSEAYEIVERVAALKKDWPSSWGKFSGHSIGILTPYADQVFRIRAELRKRSLSYISVERVLNVQGKQFRVVFLSVVRTALTCSNDSKENCDFGFLSDMKLLNTAITRAQSLVAVVGDPVALCTIGRCSKIWERFLSICGDNNSLNGITWQNLKSQLDGLELKRLYGLNPLAPEFVPRQLQQNDNRNGAYVLFRFTYVPNPVQYTWPVQLGPPMYMQPPLPMPLVLPPPLPVRLMPSPNMTVFVAPAPPVGPPPHIVDLPLSPSHAIQPAPSIAIPPKPPKNITSKRRTSDRSNTPVIHANGTPHSQSECNLIQFLDKVHIPKDISENGHSLHDLMNLLPKNMSLANVLLQPSSFHTQWYNQLADNKGVEAAKRFKYLISVATNKPKSGVDLPTSNSLQHESDDEDVLLSLNLPYLEQQIPDLYRHDDPINQINFDKPVYHLPNSRVQEQSDIDLNLQFTDRESTPLYQRQSVLNYEMDATKPNSS